MRVGGRALSYAMGAKQVAELLKVQRKLLLVSLPRIPLWCPVGSWQEAADGAWAGERGSWVLVVFRHANTCREMAALSTWPALHTALAPCPVPRVLRPGCHTGGKRPSMENEVLTGTEGSPEPGFSWRWHLGGWEQAASPPGSQVPSDLTCQGLCHAHRPAWLNPMRRVLMLQRPQPPGWSVGAFGWSGWWRLASASQVRPNQLSRCTWHWRRTSQ